MPNLTHLTPDGSAHMVDVGAKPATLREATATGRIAMTAEAATAIRQATLKKGDALAVARIAGIMAAKKTSDLIPLCHPIPLTSVTIELTPDDTGVTATATVRTTDRTGVEMEALTAVTTALLTVYDMTKAIDRGMTIEGVRLLTKSGGKSGDWVAEPQ
ncbi:cyclic pyranopterin monophosphate synthase MoaC [Sphingomonas aestuarii]